MDKNHLPKDLINKVDAYTDHVEKISADVKQLINAIDTSSANSRVKGLAAVIKQELESLEIDTKYTKSSIKSIKSWFDDPRSRLSHLYNSSKVTDE